MSIPTALWPDSLWRATADPDAGYPSLKGEHRADVCIVGGGYTGLSAALHLAEGGAQVVLAEAHGVGWGASGRNGGQVIPGLKLDPDELLGRLGAERGERAVAFAGASADLVFDLIERHDIDCDAERSGWISAMHASTAKRALHSRIEQWQQRGAALRWLDAQQMREQLGAECYAGGMLDPRGGRLQPLAYARGLARAAAQHGARVFESTPAELVTRAQGGWRVLTEQGSVIAPMVLLCTNAYTDGLWPGLAQSVIPVFSYQVATAPLSDNLRATILPGGQVVSDTRRLLRYFRLDGQGRLLMGGRGRSRDSSDPQLYRDVIATLWKTFPRLSGVELSHYWGGQVAITLDHLPHLHELAPGVHAGLGYNGRGVAMATAMGKLLAQRAAGLGREEIPFPTSTPQGVRFHGLRAPALRAVAAWRSLLDAVETRFSG